MADVPEIPQPDSESQARKLIEEGSGKKLLSGNDVSHANQVGTMKAGPKLEFYSHLLRTQLEKERDRLLAEKMSLEAECNELRASDKELHALKKTLVRDRWEYVVVAVAMALGGSLIGSFPPGTQTGFAGITASALFGTGWALILIGTAWQVGKVAIISVHDALTKTKTTPAKKQ